MKPTGFSKDSGWMVGARRTFTIPTDSAWKLVTSKKGISAWLGNLPEFISGWGAAFRMADGTHGEVTTFIPGSQIRLTWQPKGYMRPSVIQMRVIPNGEKTTITFHQEQLPDVAARTECGEYFRGVLVTLGKLIRKVLSGAVMPRRNMKQIVGLEHHQPNLQLENDRLD